MMEPITCTMDVLRSSGCVLDCQVAGARFKPRDGQKFGSRLMRSLTPPLEPQVK